MVCKDAVISVNQRESKVLRFLKVWKMIIIEVNTSDGFRNIQAFRGGNSKIPDVQNHEGKSLSTWQTV